MAAPVAQSGALVACPNCNTEVMQKAMIPVGALDGVPFYLCVVCARELLKTEPADKTVPAGSAEPGDKVS